MRFRVHGRSDDAGEGGPAHNMAVIWLTFSCSRSDIDNGSEFPADLRGRRHRAPVIIPLSDRDTSEADMTLRESLCTVQTSFFRSK